MQALVDFNVRTIKHQNWIKKNQDELYMKESKTLQEVKELKKMLAESQTKISHENVTVVEILADNAKLHSKEKTKQKQPEEEESKYRKIFFDGTDKGTKRVIII